MPRSPSATATGFYHVVSRSADQVSLFDGHADYLAFLGILRQGLGRYQTPLISYCVLENRWHLLVGPVGKSRLMRTLQWVTTTHAQCWHRNRGAASDAGAAYLSHVVSTPIQDLAALVPMSRYVERNPKSAGLVDRAEDWPWSSLRQRVRGPQLVPVTPAAFLATRSWVDYVNAAITRQERLTASRASDRVLRPRAVAAAGIDQR